MSRTKKTKITESSEETEVFSEEEEFFSEEEDIETELEDQEEEIDNFSQAEEEPIIESEVVVSPKPSLAKLPNINLIFK